MLLALSIVINLGILCFFKYYNFFAANLIDLLDCFGITLRSSTLNIILPVGISFYTFQTMSYSIDIYRGKMDATNDPIAFFAFVSFFPQLVAGPIERARRLLPQFHRSRSFNHLTAVDGIRQITWGLFKKIVVADNCAVVVDTVFNNFDALDGSALFLGAFFFSFQIYGDFSGYSDIAIGTAKLFGIDLMSNFETPYFSRNIGEFWRRWHISLSTWFRDYVYIPLGGSKVSKARQAYNIIVTFTLSGLWHGANWTFLAWGFLNGVYYMPLMLFNNRENFKSSIVAADRFLPTIREFVQVITTFMLTLIAWVLFRAENIKDAALYIGRMFSASLFSNPAHSLRGFGIKTTIIYGFFAISFLLIIEWIHRGEKHGFTVQNRSKPLNWSLYTCVIFFIVMFRNTGQNLDFIYFQF